MLATIRELAKKVEKLEQSTKTKSFGFVDVRGLSVIAAHDLIELASTRHTDLLILQDDTINLPGTTVKILKGISFDDLNSKDCQPEPRQLSAQIPVQPYAIT